MAGLGLLLSGLSGAGRGLAQTAAQDEENRMLQERQRLEEEKMLRIDEMKRQRDRQQNVQMGQDINAATTQIQNQRDIDAINAANGSNATAEDAQVLRNNPEARKAYGLLASSRQTDLEDRATAAANLGYVDAARETRGELQAEITNQRNKDVDASTNRRLDQQDKRQEQQDAYNRRREDRLDRLAESQLAWQKARAGKEDERATAMAEREARMATTSALKGAEMDVKSLQKDLADPLLAEEQKKILQDQLNTARADVRKFRSALGSAGLESAVTPAKPFDPANYRSGSSAGSSGSGGRSTTANPFESGTASAQPVQRQQSPQALAKSGLDAAIDKTVRALTEANNRGDASEARRLQDLLQEQQSAKARL